MSRAAGTEALRQLLRAGYDRHLRETAVHGVSISFYLSSEGRARLAMDERFAQGPLHHLHSDVGDDLTDYRAYHGAFGKGSLQIVVDRSTGRAYADVDRWSPYGDVAGFLGHTGEVIGGFFTRLFRKGKR
jgi:hypothetical protein